MTNIHEGMRTEPIPLLPEKRKIKSPAMGSNRPEASIHVEGADKNRERALEQHRALEISREMDKIVLEILRSRLQEPGLSEKERQTLVEHLKAIEELKTGMMIKQGTVGAGGNGVEEHRMLIDEKATSVFVKLQYGERSFEYDEELQQWFVINESLDDGGHSVEARIEPVTSPSLISTLDGKRNNHEGWQATWMNATHLPVDKLPMSANKNRQANMAMAPGFGVYAEAAAYALSLVTRSYRTLPTTIRETGDAISSVQKGIKNIQLLSDSILALSIIEEGSESPEKEAFADQSLDHALMAATDATLYNSADHEGELVDFDNGYTNGLVLPIQVKDANGNDAPFSVPVNGYNSFAMSIMNRPDMKEVKASEKKLQEYREAGERLHLSNTHEAKLTILAFRLLYERTDSAGKVLPESTALAYQQAKFYYERLQYLARNERPPKLPETSLRTIPMEEIRQRLYWMHVPEQVQPHAG